MLYFLKKVCVIVYHSTKIFKFTTEKKIKNSRYNFIHVLGNFNINSTVHNIAMNHASFSYHLRNSS